MPNPLPIELRERAVAAYLEGDESAETVALRYGIGQRTLQRWIALKEDSGTLTPRPRGGGWRSPVVMVVLHKLIARDASVTAGELTVAYNREVSRGQRVHRSSIFRALHREGYVFK